MSSQRDRVRRALQSSFSRKNKGSDSASSDANNSGKEDLYRRTSLSENEAAGSQSEADETDEEKIRPLSGGKPRSRHNSLDPSRLSRSSLKPPEHKHSSSSARSSRDPSPLGRALSNLSHGSNGSRHHHLHRHGKGKIPRPTPEQVAYIRRVLVDVPGPTPSLPPGLRVARPPGETQSTDSLSSLASSSSASTPRSKFDVDWQNTDLFECFRQFTSVEVLDGENSFACRNCWKCLNPELEIKHKEEKMQRKMQRRTARALKHGQKKKAAQNGAGAEEDEEAADETAKNSPVTRPVQLADVPTMNLEEASEATPPAADPVPHLHHPRRNFSASTAVSSQPSLISSEGGDVSENALDTATEDEDDEFSASDLNGDADSLSGGPAIEAPKLPLTAENIKVVEANMGHLSVAGTAAGGTSSHPIQPPSIATAATHKAPIPANPSTPAAPSPAPQPALGKAPPKAQRHILRRAHKRYLISPAELPPVLVIHLKRFMQTSKSSLFGSAFVNLKKRDDPVSFPKEMDLTPFLAPRGKPPKNPWVEEIDQAHKAHWKHWGLHCKPKREDGGVASDASSARVATPPAQNDQPETIELERENQDTKYRLYAVVVHFGTIDTGHYAAYVLSNRYGKGEKFGQGERKWIFTSDEDVKHVSEAEVLKSKAYMLYVFLPDSRVGHPQSDSSPFLQVLREDPFGDSFRLFPAARDQLATVARCRHPCYAARGEGTDRDAGADQDALARSNRRRGETRENVVDHVSSYFIARIETKVHTLPHTSSIFRRKKNGFGREASQRRGERKPPRKRSLSRARTEKIIACDQLKIDRRQAREKRSNPRLDHFLPPLTLSFAARSLQDKTSDKFVPLSYQPKSRPRIRRRPRRRGSSSVQERPEGTKAARHRTA